MNKVDKEKLKKILKKHGGMRKYLESIGKFKDVPITNNKELIKMKCKCGFKFSGAGEFRNCEAFIKDGESYYVCPKCRATYKGVD